MKILATINKFLTLVIIQLSQNMVIQKKIVVGKMKHETARVVTEEFPGLKPKMYSYQIDDNSEHKKAKGVNKNVPTTISHNEYKDVFVNKKCLRHSINSIQSKDHRINKISWSCFDDKIHPRQWM